MEDPSLTRRVEILEQHLELLKALPARVSAVEAQIVQLRDEMHVGFSALSGELRSEMRAGDQGLREEIEDVRLEMRAMHQETLMRFEMQDQKIEGLDRHMHVLHEDLIERIARLGERRG